MSGKKKLICDLDAELMEVFAKTVKQRGDSMTRVVGYLIEEFLMQPSFARAYFNTSERLRETAPLLRKKKIIKTKTRHAS